MKFLSILIWFSGSVAWAAVVPTTTSTPPATAASITLTWQTCVREALTHNPGALAAIESVNKAQAQYHSSLSGFFPELTATAGYLNGNTTASGTSDSLSQNTKEDFSAALTLQQNLFAGFRNQGQAALGQAQLEAAQALYEIETSKLFYDLRLAYAELAFAQKQAQMAELISQRLKDNVRLVQLRFDRGRENKGSLLTTQASSFEADYEVASARRMIQVSQRGLLRLLGRDESVTVKVEDIFDQSPLVEAPPDFKKMAENSPQRKKAQADTRVSQAEITVARSGFFPELNATAAVGKRGATFPPDKDKWSMGINLVWHLFSGTKDHYEVQRARAENYRTHYILKNTELQTLQELESFYAKFQDAVGLGGVQRELLRAAETRVEISRAKYTNGLLSFEDWDTIEKELISRQKQWLGAQKNAVIAEAAWGQAQGKGLHVSENDSDLPSRRASRSARVATDPRKSKGS